MSCTRYPAFSSAWHGMSDCAEFSPPENKAASGVTSAICPEESLRPTDP